MKANEGFRISYCVLRNRPLTTWRGWNTVYGLRIPALDCGFVPTRRCAVPSNFSPKSIALLFVAVLGLYLATFYTIERARLRKGPWEVDFQTNAEGNATLVVHQPRLGLADVRIVFHGERATATNLPAHVSFDRVKLSTPFGRVIYEDLTFLPGVVTFDLFGHEIELLPRTLIVNKRQVPWQSGAAVDLWPTNKPAEPPQPPKPRNR